MTWSFENVEFTQPPFFDRCNIDDKQYHESEKNPSRVLLALSKNDQFHFIDNNRDTLVDLGRLEEVIADFYTDHDSPFLGREIWWVLISDLCNDEKLRNLESLQPFNLINEKVVIYRGALTARPAGISWTLDIKKSKWFANRYLEVHQEKTAVYSITVDRNDIWFCTNCRDELEIVLKPHLVRKYCADLVPITD